MINLAKYYVDYIDIKFELLRILLHDIIYHNLYNVNQHKIICIFVFIPLFYHPYFNPTKNFQLMLCNSFIFHGLIVYTFFVFQNLKLHKIHTVNESS